MKAKEIDLRKYKNAESRVFTGREEGKKARIDSHLDDLDKTNELIKVIIPDDTVSINSSFFLGMFKDSLEDLKEEKFKEKYKFICNKDFIIKVNIENNIKLCLLRIKMGEKDGDV